MKDAYEVLQQKEADLARVRQEIASLRIAASLLSNDLTSDELSEKCVSPGEKTLGGHPESEATGTDGLSASIAVSRPRIWSLLKRGK